jgi:hypothetical protein
MPVEAVVAEQLDEVEIRLARVEHGELILRSGSGM